MLEGLPALYSTEEVSLDEKVVHMHFFLGGSDWYAAEYGLKDRLFFGYAILNNDLVQSEWGYFSLDELQSIRTKHGIEVDRDLYWKPTKARDIEKIQCADAYRRSR